MPANSKSGKKPKETKSVTSVTEYMEPESINPDVAPIDRNIFNVDPLLTATELGNTLRLTWIYAALIFFHHELKKWFCWDGKRWAIDTTNQALKKLIHVLLKDRTFRATVDPKWYAASFSNSKLRAVLKIAADLLPLPSPLDSHPYYLNVANGTVDLCDGKLLPHDKALYITKLAPVEYDPEATCPMWLEFLNRAFKGVTEHIVYLQKVIGYALTSDVSEKCFFILFGPGGNNGKSLLINVLRAILGIDYRIQIAAESLTINRVSAIRSDIARMRGYRFASASETDKAYKFNEPLIKTITGADAVTARKLYQNEIEFVPELKLFIATNAKPQFNLADKAMMSRVNVIPFTVSIPSEEQDRNLTARMIEQESAGILAWAVQGAVLWHAERLGPNPFPQDDAVILISLSEFIKMYCTVGKDLKVKSTDLLALYNHYKTDLGDDSPDLKIKEFDQLLKEANYPSKHERDCNYRLGIGLNAAGKELLATLAPAPTSPRVKDVKDVKDKKQKKSN